MKASVDDTGMGVIFLRAVGTLVGKPFKNCQLKEALSSLDQEGIRLICVFGNNGNVLVEVINRMTLQRLRVAVQRLLRESELRWKDIEVAFRTLERLKKLGKIGRSFPSEAAFRLATAMRCIDNASDSCYSERELSRDLEGEGNSNVRILRIIDAENIVALKRGGSFGVVSRFIEEKLSRTIWTTRSVDRLLPSRVP